MTGLDFLQFPVGPVGEPTALETWGRIPDTDRRLMEYDNHKLRLIIRRSDSDKGRLLFGYNPSDVLCP